MTTRHAMAWTLAAALALAALAGCKNGAPVTELDRYAARTTDLEGRALEDTLWAAVHGGPPNSVFASFLLGNRFYNAAGDSAYAVGWADPGVNALLDSAEVHFSRAVALDSTFIQALVNLGTVWDDRAEGKAVRNQIDADLAQARHFYEMALSLDPADQKARCNLGGLYLRQRRTPEALAEFHKALEYDPESSLAHYNLAIMFAEAKIYREAIREWELAAKYDPDGDIGDRSRENVRIVKDLVNAPPPGAAHP